MLRTFLLTAAAAVIAAATVAAPGTPLVEVEKLIGLKHTAAVEMLRSSGHWRTVEWFARDETIFLHSASLAGHKHAGMEGAGAKGEDGAVTYYKGRLISVMVNLYPGPPATAELFRSVLGISAKPPAPDTDRAAGIQVRDLGWKQLHGERRFGPVWGARLFHQKVKDGPERTCVSVDLADEHTMKQWVDAGN